MSDILVRPPELRAAATQLRAHAKRIQSAIDELDTLVKSVMPGRFEGQRAAAIIAKYRVKRIALLFAASLVTRFAQELEETAARFEQADRGEGNIQLRPFPPGGAVPMPPIQPAPPRWPGEIHPRWPGEIPIPPDPPDDGWRIPPNWPLPQPGDPEFPGFPWDKIFPDEPSPPPDFPWQVLFPEEPKIKTLPYYETPFRIPDDWQTQPPSIEFADDKPEGSIPTWINYLINSGWRYENGSWTNSEE